MNNLPGLATYTLGSMILFHLSILVGILYIFFCVLGTVFFWMLICPFCLSFDRECCPCGYGKVSSRFFKRGDPSNFPKMFKMYIPIFSLLWILPLLAGIILLLMAPSLYLLLLLLSFIVVGFILVPLFSRVHGCKDCPIRDRCPWAK
ncbi:MAG: hypothetical protein ACE5KV_02105 [Thermoplasmata archaeon]